MDASKPPPRDPGESVDDYMARIASTLLPSSLVMLPRGSLSGPEIKAFFRGTDEQLVNRILGMAGDGSSARDLVLQSVELINQVLGGVLQPVHPHQVPWQLGRRIDLAEKTGLASPMQQARLHVLREIRNKFAHDPDLHFLSYDEDVMAWIDAMPQPPPLPYLDREGILRTNFAIEAAMLLRSLIAP